MASIPKTHWKKVGSEVVVTCPGCNLKAYLDHDVAADGTVTPSLDCPECSFHEHVKLEGWG